MKRTLLGFTVVLLALGLVLASCTSPVNSVDSISTGRAAAVSGIVWNGDSDKAVAADIDATVSIRNDASGTKIASNAQSADYPGVYFIWDSKQKDNGYLKVDASVFDKYESFVLTSKESNTYWDFLIQVQPDQKKTADNCYVFYIPKVYNNKNINMVFIGEWVLKGDTVITAHLGFIGYYVNDGKVMSTSIYWQDLNQGDMIDWAAVDAAYADWVAKGNLAPDRTTWQTSGYASFTFADYAPIGYDDFTAGQLEGYYLNYYVDPGYVLPNQVETRNIEVFEDTVGGQYSWGGTYDDPNSFSPTIYLAGNDYTYEIVSRTPWPTLNNIEGVSLPVIGTINRVLNINGQVNTTLPRAGYYVINAYDSTGKLAIIFNITITPAVKDQ
ncbi:MAG: hypothetical protein FWF26_02315 [Treponema sp.]|nr:hypothetical protein [Treponema sp.]